MELTLHPFIQNILNSASNELFQYLLLFVFSMMPVTECRLTIPFGILVFGLPWYIVLPVCVLSNAFIGAFLVLALDKLIIIFSKVKFLRTIIDRLIVSSKGKYKKYNRFKSSGLLLFVGIPFPGTGAWTGALISYVIGLHKGLSMISIVQGVILSGIIMTILSLSGKAIIL